MNHPADPRILVQVLDLCCAFAMDEAASIRHRLPIRSSEWTWLPNEACVALGPLADQATFVLPTSLKLRRRVGKSRDATLRLTPLAVEIVPIHEQAEAMYAWLGALVELESEGLLEEVDLPPEAANMLRAIPFGYRELLDDVAAQRVAYQARHGDLGGWTQLAMIIDWIFFIHTWRLLEQRHQNPYDFTTSVQNLGTSARLLTLGEVRAMASR